MIFIPPRWRELWPEAFCFWVVCQCMSKPSPFFWTQYLWKAQIFLPRTDDVVHCADCNGFKLQLGCCVDFYNHVILVWVFYVPCFVTITLHPLSPSSPSLPVLSIAECCSTPYSLLGLVFTVSFIALGVLTLCKFYLQGYRAFMNDNTMHRSVSEDVCVGLLRVSVGVWLSVLITLHVHSCAGGWPKASPCWSSLSRPASSSFRSFTEPSSSPSSSSLLLLPSCSPCWR